MAGTQQVQTSNRLLYEKTIECPVCGPVVIAAATPNLAAASLEVGGSNQVHGDHIRAAQRAVEERAAFAQVRAARVEHEDRQRRLRKLPRGASQRQPAVDVVNARKHLEEAERLFRRRYPRSKLR